MSLYNLKYNTVLFLLGLILGNVAFAMEQQSAAIQQPEAMKMLIAKQPSSTRQKWVDLIETMYKSSYDTFRLYVNEVDLPDSSEGLKALFSAFNLIPYDYPVEWTDQLWEQAYASLLSFKGGTNRPVIRLDEVPTLLEIAKSIVKSFLPINDTEVPIIIANFLKKSLTDSLNRLFTYSYLSLVIPIRKLTHIKLPRKVLLIQNKETKEYLSNEEAQRIIDDTLKFYVYSSWNRGEVNGRILFDSDKYELKFFAQKESINGKGLSANSRSELETLCKFAPFDIGDDNIFWDAKGNAIIIDTEYKGEYASSACPKINRYPVDLSL